MWERRASLEKALSLFTSVLRGWTATEGCRVVCQIQARLYQKKKCRYGTSFELANSVLEINHVTNVTKVLNETTASDRVSRSKTPFKQGVASPKNLKYVNVRLAPPPVHIVLY